MKRALYPILILLLAPFSIFASHSMGTDITYRVVSGCTTEVVFKAYRDCSGSSSIPVTTLDIIGNGTCTDPTLIGAWTPTQIVEVTPICPSALTNCNTLSSPIRGVEEYYATSLWSFCASGGCTSFTLSWSLCCRNAAITSLVNASSQSTYVTNAIPATSVVNNAPTFTSYPFFFGCATQPVTVNQGAYDIDGDSLAYRLGTCMTSGGNPVSYDAANGFSATAPMGPNWSVSINPLNGNLSFYPTPGGIVVGVMCIYVEEWRNGVLIGEIERDVQVAMEPCAGGNTPPQFNGYANLSAGLSESGDTFKICAQDTIRFDLLNLDANPSSVLELAWDQNISGASLFDYTNPTVQDTVYGAPAPARFEWVPTANGRYNFTVRLTDDACPRTQYQEKMITIEVGLDSSLQVGVTPTSCLSVDFEALGCSGATAFTWSGTGGLSGTGSSISHTYSAPGTYSYTLTGSGGGSGTVTGSITVPLPQTASLITQTQRLKSCTGNPGILTAPAGYSAYAWSTGAATQSISATVAGNYSVTATDGSGCTYTDDFLLLAENFVDLSGIARDASLAPLEVQKVLLIRYDTTGGGTLTAIDSTLTDSLGYFEFCEISDTMLFVKVTPDSATYPLVMPTYASASLFWNTADTFSVLNVPETAIITAVTGTNPGGPGFIGGLISLGANKTSGVGDPVPNQIVFIRDAATDNPIAFTYTDANGYFSFGGLNYGDYEIAVDVPGVDHINTPMVPLSASLSNRDSLDFRLHSTYLEWVQLTSVEPAVSHSVHIYPNPSYGRFQFDTEGKADKIEVFDVNGRVVGRITPTGTRVTWDARQNHLEAGIYFARITFGDETITRKLVLTATR